jgi:hypothetical protein
MSADKQAETFQHTHRTTWNDLIEATEARLAERHAEIQRLTKSLAFFKKQNNRDLPFPLKSEDKVKRR